jgi:hypothetical protein
MRIKLPGGVIIQARGWSSSVSTEGDTRPDWGLYLDRGWAERAFWPHRLIDWPDYGVPPEDNEWEAFEALMEAWYRASDGESVEVGCTGGTGRTGTALACLAVLAGLPAAEAIEWVRSHYHLEAIETEAQEALVARFAAAVMQAGRATQSAARLRPDEASGVRTEVILLRDQLLSNLNRWEPELANWRGKRGTLWYGIFDKVCKGVERLLGAATTHFLMDAGDPGHKILTMVSEGKTVDRLTLGQHLDVLRALDKRQLLAPNRRLLRKVDLKLLERVVGKRNDFEHGRLDYSERAIEETHAILADVRAVCHAPIVSSVVKT